MKKLIAIIFLAICFKSNSQINLATTLRQDSIIKYEKLILATLNGTTSPAISLNYTYSVTASITGTALTDVLAAPGSSLYIYITDILVTNSSTVTGTWVNITEQTSGKILWTGYASANGGGFSTSLKTPIRTPLSNKKVQVYCETTGTETRVSMSGFKGN